MNTMKIKTTMKEITNRFRTFQTGYCSLQYIFHNVEPSYYNCGIYGWNNDVYVDYNRNIAITTGYRNMRGQYIPYEIIEKYNLIAEKILDYRNKIAWEEKINQINQNRENFLNEISNL